MQIIKQVGDLPTPVRVMAENFYNADIHEPELYFVSKDEYDTLATNQDVVTQLLYWREQHKFFAVVVGDAERKVQSELIHHDPFRKKVSLLAFYEVDEAGIREWNKKYSEKALREGPIEFTDDIREE
tara:strand:+ start:684 stop:1064 length:381 start_codon:yes stop_codon:yes gene_type:complete